MLDSSLWEGAYKKDLHRVMQVFRYSITFFKN